MSLLFLLDTEDVKELYTFKAFKDDTTHIYECQLENRVCRIFISQKNQCLAFADLSEH